MKKILIIEDDLSIAELEKDYLEMSGMSADICADGVEGLDKALKENYDLILLDIMLPCLDGISVLKNIREIKDIPVLLISAKKEEIDKIRGLGAGAEDYISKPFSPGELVARVKAHLANYDRLTKNSGKVSGNQHKLSIRSLTIDKYDRRVFINNKEIILCAKEFDILLYLAKNPNRVYSREEIFNYIWGVDSFGDSSTVTVHIARIRDKVETDPQNPQYIETVWGAGYRFKV
jgi:DNA-binding response OmpR family regulator